MKLKEFRSQIISKDINIRDVMKCTLGLRDLEIDAYFELIRKPMKVNELAKQLERNRSTIQRVVTNLIAYGLAHRRVKTVRGGGYFYEYI